MNWNQRIQDAVKARTEANQPIWKLIASVKKDGALTEATRNSYLTTLYGSLSDKDVPQALVGDTNPYNVGVSFRSSINDLRRVKQRMSKLGTSIFPGGNPKLKDRAFAVSLGVPVPRTYAENRPLSEIELQPNSILKPVGGSSSMGVFLVDDQCKLHSIRTSAVYKSVREALTEIEKYKGRISTDRWLLEEAILKESGQPANDLKVYAFYGIAGMFLEIDRHLQTVPKYATYNEYGELIGLGPRYQSFTGSGIPSGVRDMVKTMSLAAPVPFLRFDFHMGVGGIYLGEITPHPGGTYAGELYESVDSMLGNHFANAKARLYLDLLKGKKFPEFVSAYGVEYA